MFLNVRNKIKLNLIVFCSLWNNILKKTNIRNQKKKTYIWEDNDNSSNISNDNEEEENLCPMANYEFSNSNISSFEFDIFKH